MPTRRQFTGAIFEGLHIAVTRSSETHQRRIDSCLNDTVKAPRQGEKLRGVSQAESASYFFQGDIVARFRAGLIQLGRGLGIDDFLLTEFGKEGNSHLNVAVWEGIHQRLKAVAVGGHTLIVASRAMAVIERGKPQMDPRHSPTADYTSAAPTARGSIRITLYEATRCSLSGVPSISEHYFQRGPGNGRPQIASPALNGETFITGPLDVRRRRQADLLVVMESK
ncbi:MAG: hypothetical protein KIT09_12485 [Bryobacteraceae bacterium]|nr:hypothetical protein [Bryobacteraceae bacterium]